MKNMAKKYEHLFAAHAVDLDEIAVQKDNNFEGCYTAWIFADGSAITQSGSLIGVINNYGFNKDFEQLK